MSVWNNKKKAEAVKEQQRRMMMIIQERVETLQLLIQEAENLEGERLEFQKKQIEYQWELVLEEIEDGISGSRS